MIQDIVDYVQRVYASFPNEQGEWTAADVVYQPVPSKNQHIMGFSHANPILKITESSKSEIIVELFYTPEYSLELDDTVLKRVSSKRTVQAFIDDKGITLFYNTGHSCQYLNATSLVNVLVGSNLLLDTCYDE